MKILCNHCKHFFEVDPEKDGRIQYSKTKSIFRVELILKSPCPECASKLKVITNEKKENIGYVYEPTAAKKVAPRPAEKKQPSQVTSTSETVYNPAPKKPVVAIAPKEKATPKQTVISKVTSLENAETRIAITPDEITGEKKLPTVNKSKKAPVLEDQVKVKLKQRLDSFHRYNVQSYKINTPASSTKKKNKKFYIPNVSKIAYHASQPKVYITGLTLVAVFIISGVMKMVFDSSQDAQVMAQKEPEMESTLEEFEPTHPHDAAGGPSFPSELDKKTGLEDETIRKMKSNLQILHLPPLNQVTSTYGIRLDPFTKKLAFHAGVDFKANTGTKIEAAMDGVVKFSGRRNMYGNAVIIKHDNGYESLYGHLSKINVKQGQIIKQKDIIGLAGSTGRSTGPHLHFELIKNGKKIDPLSTDLITTKKKK
jgi:murein DD-endopeptidase MepM/ murein hydrolase activator NlpD